MERCSFFGAGDPFTLARGSIHFLYRITGSSDSTNVRALYVVADGTGQAQCARGGVLFCYGSIALSLLCSVVLRVGQRGG